MGTHEPVTSTAPVSLAPLWRRSVAWLIDVWNVLAVGTAGIGGVVSGAVLIGEAAERNDRFGRWLEHAILKTGHPDGSRFELAARWGPALFGIGLTDAILRRNRRTYGQTVMRISRADASTGGPVTIRSAIARYVASALISALKKRTTAPLEQRHRDALKSLRPEIAELARKHPDHQLAFWRGVWTLSRERGADPFTAVKVSTAAQVAAHFVCVLLAPKRQGVADLLAGTVTVRDNQTTRTARACSEPV